MGPDFPLYYSSFAIARYHRSFPHEVFARYCQGAAPQVYWNAFRWPMQQAVRWTYEDYTALGEAPQRLFPVAGLYAGRRVSYPAADDVKGFAGEAAGRGSPGISFWSYEHMNEEMWAAVSALGGPRQEVEMSSLEFQQLSSTLATLADRVGRVEKDVAALKARASKPSSPTQPSHRTYTVCPGDTLSGIAARFGIADWRTLYQANKGVVGPDPNLILPGQELTIPR